MTTLTTTKTVVRLRTTTRLRDDNLTKTTTMMTDDKITKMTTTMTTMMTMTKNKMMLTLIGIWRILQGVRGIPGVMYNIMVGTIAYKII